MLSKPVPTLLVAAAMAIDESYRTTVDSVSVRECRAGVFEIVIQDGADKVRQEFTALALAIGVPSVRYQVAGMLAGLP